MLSIDGDYRHVVLMSLDTLRSDVLAGNPHKLWPDKYGPLEPPDTAVVDELVSEGAFFANCISAAPYTSASHATYLTGRWPRRHGVFELFNRRLRATTLFGYARRMGFRTALKTDFPLILGKHLGFLDDVDDFLVEDDDGALELLHGRQRMCMLVHFGGMHIPYGFHNLRFGGEAYADKVAELEAELPRVSMPVSDRLTESYRGEADLDLLMRYKRVVQRLYSEAAYGRLFQLYLEGITFFCRKRLTPFVAGLREALGDDSLLVVFGDHGEEYDRESYGHHNTLAEGVIRVPLIFHAADVHPSRQTQRVRTVDVLPTVLERLGYLRRGRLALDGRSLAGSVWDGRQIPRRPAIAQVWTAETAPYVRFQQRVLSTGRKTGSLPHVLYRECGYDGDHKLSLQHYRYSRAGGIWGLEPSVLPPRLERVTPDLRLVQADDQAVGARIATRLDAYNRTGRL